MVSLMVLLHHVTLMAVPCWYQRPKSVSKIFVIHLSGLTFSITPDEALVETRRKLVIKRKKFGGGRTIRDILVHPKDKDTILKKSGVIYKYSCGRVDCGEEYIGESGRTFGERYREHMRSPSPIMDHHNTTGHEVSLDNFTIVGREDNNIARNIREAIFIRVNDPSLNRNIGKFQLPHIWDEVLAKSPELHLK